jgi:hypothetical protein
MTHNRWIENSKKAYRTLLNLYPGEHRGHFGVSMQQVFTDQCCSAFQQKGIPGILLLWLRTLPDLGYTALLEHITSPGATWGLMEPVPNAPLPWKGVLLILLPGLVYLVSQIAQLVGEPWYLTVYYRAAFLLILPVLVVWAITRRFPIWGLIPIGLLYRLVQEIGYQFIMLHPGVFSSNPLLNAVLTAATMVDKNPLIPILLFIISILFLAWRYIWKQKPSRSFWMMTGIYLLIFGIQITNNVINYAHQSQVNSFLSLEVTEALINNSIWDLYNFSALLLLIFLGTLFTRRHGFFAILIPMGYILPSMLIGASLNLDDVPDSAATLVIVSIAVLSYRLLLSMVAPIWMSRTSSQSGKKRIILFSIVIALSIHLVMQFYPTLPYPQHPANLQWGIYVVLDELKLISAMMLGLVMYQNTLAGEESTAHPLTPNPEFPLEKA